MDINWYPGHMAKTRRMILDTLKQIDLIVELVDARIPQASKNPDIKTLAENKPKLLILNKSDLADPKQNEKWLHYYQQQGYTTMLFNSKASGSAKQIFDTIRDMNRERAERDKARGILARNVRIMILGIPNVGKSTFINKLCGSKRADVQDRPGVTRGKQWVSLADGIDLLDTPGILWPKLENQGDAALLAMTGSIKDSILDLEGLSLLLLDMLRKHYPQMLKERYKLEELNPDSYELLKQIGKKRGFVVSGGEINTERTAIILLDEFRAAKIGRITAEHCYDI